LAQAFELALQ
jgi:hypothetical protein